MSVRLRFPYRADIEVAGVLAGLADPPAGDSLSVGDERIVDFLVDVGRRLIAPSLARRFPQLGSLGFFLRRGALAAALAGLATDATVLRFPRGLVFHIPPTNVDTAFIYSWALAALAGNRNIVRLSPRMAGATEVAVGVLHEALADADPVVARTQRMVSYERDADVTAVLCGACDLRVIWGSDGSVDELRRFPLRPAARDLTFPDRSSFAVLSTQAWRMASPARRRAVAEGLHSDVYWFDQAACGSPRAVIWVGSADTADEARTQLSAELAAVVGARGPEVTASMAMHKYTAAYSLAADGTANGVRFPSNAIAHVELVDGARIPRRWLGAGTFVWTRADRLTDIVPMVRRQDQTVTHFGFTTDELMAFARACGGRGVDRLVPVGRALQFAPLWDGYDLMREFTRLTTVNA